MDPNLIRWHEIDFRGSQGQYGAYAPTLKLLHESRFDIKPMCTHVFRLDGAQERMDRLTECEALASSYALQHHISPHPICEFLHPLRPAHMRRR